MPWNRYDYISRRFLASLGLDCEYESTEITIACGVDGQEHFSTNGLKVVNEGFTVGRDAPPFVDDVFAQTLRGD